MAIDCVFMGLIKGPTTLQATPQAFSNGWADLGDEIETKGAQTIVLWITVTINNSQNLRARLLAKREEDGTDEYLLPIRTIAADVVLIEDEYLEANEDVSESMALSWALDGAIPFVQFQIQAGTVGTLPATVDTAYVTAAVRSA
jgi:hypothetical protein